LQYILVNFVLAINETQKMLMIKTFTQTQLEEIDNFLNKEINEIEKEIILSKRSEEKTIQFLNDYSKSVRFKDSKDNNPIILN